MANELLKAAVAALKVLIAGASGVVAVAAAFFVLGRHDPPVASNAGIVAVILAPFAIGLIVAVAVYRILWPTRRHPH
jgi:hypothetical protein